MALECERKFLLTDDSWRQQVARSEVMQQVYLAQGRLSVRVRIVGDGARLILKQGHLGPEREEFVYPMPLADARRLVELAGHGAIRKTRHYLPAGGLTWEIDEFHDDNEGLVVAELELSDPDQPFDHPQWLGREVTFEERYYNGALAITPFSHWPAETGA